MSDYSIGERRILLKAMIVRRVPKNTRIESLLLMEALQADHEKVQQETPHLYFANWHSFLAQEVDDCLLQELIDDGVRIVRGQRHGPAKHGYIRTDLGDLFLKTLGDRLSDALDDMPMSDVGVLDFLSLL